jgi:hypothetical protein
MRLPEVAPGLSCQPFRQYGARLATYATHEISDTVGDGWVEGAPPDAALEPDGPAFSPPRGATEEGGPSLRLRRGVRRVLGIAADDSRRLTRDELLLGLFLYYFDEEVVGLICKATNSKAREWVVKEGRKFTAATRTARGARQRAGNEWQDVDAAEMYTFLGMHITMGAYPRQRLRMFWSDEDAELRLPSVADSMPRNRYEQI